MSEAPETTLLEDALDIPAWLDADGATPLAERYRRDREIGRRAAGTDLVRVRRWWQAIGADRSTLPGRRLDHARRWIGLALALAGVVGGAGLALAAFRYDGTYPVNVVRLLALLVVPQLVLLVASLLLIPGRLPGLRFIQDALSALNPGAIAGAVHSQIAGRSGSPKLVWSSAPSSTMRRFGKWQMLTWSQMAAVAFNAGVIATAAVLIAFTDLAFGWSTTLAVDDGTATRIVDAIATPWAGWLPGAVPDAGLVEGSQFFRLEGAGSLPASRELAGWWSFTVLAVVTYGLLPRIAFLAIAGWRLHLATRSLLLGDARVAALLERMAAPDIETQGEAQGGAPAGRAPSPSPAADAQAADAPGSDAAAAASAASAIAGSASAVIWNRCLTADAARARVRAGLGFAVTQLVEAGGGALADDRRALEPLTGTSDPVVVLTPAWEPPLLEFIDFLALLRERIGPSRAIVVAPVAEGGQAVTSIERENWRRAVGRTGDANAGIAAETV